ncbi:MAG: dolichyl-phosphate-mannose--protein mannosyltransferase [Marmoricola sp.]
MERAATGVGLLAVRTRDWFRPGPRQEWAGAVLVTLLAGFLRLWHLGSPHAFSFDETYYAKDAWSMLNFGYARNYVDDANAHILHGHVLGQWSQGPEMIVHPDVGKWLIALGEKAFGMDPFGWRFASAVVGALMVLVMIRLARRVTGSNLLGLVAGLLMCFDGMQLVLSRLALLDIFLAFFTLCAVHCMVVDRDWGRRRLERLTDGRQVTGWGPRLWWRPWRLAAGLCWGLALGSKWDAIFPLAAFGILMWLWDAGARRRIGVRMAVVRSAMVDALPALGYVVVVPLVVYVASWTGWLIHADAFERSLSNTQYGPYWGSYLQAHTHGFFPELVRHLRSLWHYHQDVYAFHTEFLVHAHHTYQSNPLGWMVLNRPVGIDAQLNIQPGVQGCAAATGSTCLRQVLLLGTPALWWFGTAAAIWSLVCWIGRRDWRYGLVVVGIAACWLPWFRYDDRPIFSYYAMLFEPFLVLGATMLLGTILGRGRGHTPRRTVGAGVAGAVVVAVVLNFAWFWPIYTNGLLTNAQWLQRIWFKRWI